MTLKDRPLIGPYAASLHRLAMSAPEYPDVLSAISTTYNKKINPLFSTKSRQWWIQEFPKEAEDSGSRIQRWWFYYLLVCEHMVLLWGGGFVTCWSVRTWFVVRWWSVSTWLYYLLVGEHVVLLWHEVPDDVLSRLGLGERDVEPLDEPPPRCLVDLLRPKRNANQTVRLMSEHQSA